jgi:hypothetical protein
MEAECFERLDAGGGGGDAGEGVLCRVCGERWMGMENNVSTMYETFV